jgi:hypothetical protein
MASPCIIGEGGLRFLYACHLSNPTSSSFLFSSVKVLHTSATTSTYVHMYIQVTSVAFGFHISPSLSSDYHTW